MKHIYHYFPDLTKLQYSQFEALGTLYPEWNEKVNVISRKDIENLYVHHILHSMAIAKYFSFKQNSSVLDIGTGGGFPGIPLAILFPRVSFTLIDSIAKKIMVVETIAKEIGLKNVTTQQIRVENLHEKFDYVVSRAVTSFPEFFKMSKKNVSGIVNNKLQNGIIYLKGGDFFEEMKGFRKYKIYSIIIVR
ncbi:MAG: 16S rRNA (guanine(527)-N(7))-methyltransferase RsmG [Bacteroidales bacterium]|nr:16S rRNA (guanine(527)-N(7))-methyltransferase RsmG [Bacteroidales bacterium]